MRSTAIAYPLENLVGCQRAMSPTSWRRERPSGDGQQLDESLLTRMGQPSSRNAHVVGARHGV
jgi:hypothetical protein